MYKYVLIIGMVVLSGCIISENKVCRDQLSSSVRQINSNFRSFADNKQAEEELNMLRMRDFYSDYTDQLGSIRNELAKVAITKRYFEYSRLLDEVISESNNFFNYRASLVSNVFEMSSKLESVSYDMDQYFEQKAVMDRLQKRFSFDIYAKSDEYQENRQNVENGILDIRIYNAQYVRNIRKYEDNKIRLVLIADSLNLINKELGIIENLSFSQIISNKDDFINKLDSTYYSHYIFDLEGLITE